jgi:cellobiose-specific phosphotransferase system component IIC
VPLPALLELYNSALRDFFIMAVPLILFAALFVLLTELEGLNNKDNHTLPMAEWPIE